MTKKDYELIARALKAARTRRRRPNWNKAVDRVAEELADRLTVDNYRFQRRTFIKAAQLED